MLEKRKFLRVPHITPVYCSVDFTTHLQDISVNGCFVQTTMELTTSAELNLSFTLPNTPRIIKARGQIRWCGQYSSDKRSEATKGVGIQFDQISVEDIAVISEFVKSNASIARKSKRYELVFPVVFSEDDKNLDKEAEALDINLGGMFLRTENMLELESIVYMKFTPPGTERVLSCSAKVVYLNNHIPKIFHDMIHSGMGVSFRGISDEDLEFLNQFLENMEKEPKTRLSGSSP